LAKRQKIDKNEAYSLRDPDSKGWGPLLPFFFGTIYFCQEGTDILSVFSTFPKESRGNRFRIKCWGVLGLTKVETSRLRGIPYFIVEILLKTFFERNLPP